MPDNDLQAKITEWLEWDQNEVTRNEIETLVKENDTNELNRRLSSRMDFGTAGLRARMGAGYSMMNDLTIIQTTQGFVKHMLETCPDVQKKGVVIGYDSRHNSHRFAQLAATIIINAGIPVYLYSRIVATPFVAYGVIRLGADWGIMVTASHNPKEDNGYKVYFQNGAQIISPHDKGIKSHILANLKPLSSSWDLSILSDNPLLKDPYDEMWSAYMSDLQQLSLYSAQNDKTDLVFTYTAMHGVGHEFEKEAFKRFNLSPFIPVKEQVDPDPEFPTVKYPNPEEGKSALDLSMKTANENGSTVILANDPDADRLAIAEKQPDGKWHVFNGNEIGALLGWWAWNCWHTTHPDADVNNVYMLASTVSSKILRAISAKEGFHFEETLTGFKWMGNKSKQFLDEGKTVLFAFEEAIGFMYSTNVLDKDGVSAGAVAAEMAVHLNSQGRNLKQQLKVIYDTYGFHVCSNSYYICHDKKVIEGIFERLRNYDGPETYPKACGPYEIKFVRDLTTGFDNSKPENKATLPVSKSSQMITFTFANGCVATMRTSGTEPKIKYYTEFCAPPGKNHDDVKRELEDLVRHFINDFYQPEANKLIGRSS